MGFPPANIFALSATKFSIAWKYCVKKSFAKKIFAGAKLALLIRPLVEITILGNAVSYSFVTLLQEMF